MFATFILVLFYRYDRVTASLWIQYPGLFLGEGYNCICMHVDYYMAKKRQHHLLVLSLYSLALW
jgi:hypothetical protein